MEDKREKMVELAIKLKALSERGIGGEKDNAIDKLKLIMNKYDISVDEIGNDLRRDFDFNLKKDLPYKFISQVLASVVGKLSEYNCSVFQYKYVRNRGYKSYCLKNIGPSLFSEFIVKVEMYWNHYNTELSFFYQAYVQANKLYTKPDDNDGGRSKDLSPDELKRIMKISSMSSGIDVVQYQKRIG